MNTPNPAPIGYPPAIPGYAMGAVTFRDTQCTTTYVSACLPRIIPTIPQWVEGNLPAGQLRLTKMLGVVPDGIMFPTWRNGAGFIFNDQVFKDNYLHIDDLTIYEKEDVHEDIRRVVKTACNMAHQGFLAQRAGFSPGTPDWVAATQAVGETYNQFTTTLDGLDLNGSLTGAADTAWTLAVFFQGTDIKHRDFVSHVFPPAPITCHPDKRYPALGLGYDTVLGINTTGMGGGFISNPPSTPRLVEPVKHRGVIAPASAGLITLAMGDDTESAAVGLSGALDIDLTSCTATTCTASIQSMTIFASPFTLHGYNVAVLKLTPAEGVTGALNGRTLTVPSFRGTAEVRLADGRYDYVPIDGGVIVARWDVAANEIVAAFNFESDVDGAHVTIGGTALGSFANTSPDAVMSILAPSSWEDSDSTKIECQGPAGTDVSLTGATSRDREDVTPKLAWYRDGERVGEGVDLLLSGLSLGRYDVELRTYDSQGFVGNELKVLEVVDTLGPMIEAQDICVFPPNHVDAGFQLGRELIARAVDQCDGDVTSTIRIVGVESSLGGGVVSWTQDGACLRLERPGAATDGQVFTIHLEATDTHANTVSSTIRVSVPHDGSSHGCLKTRELSRCAEVP